MFHYVFFVFKHKYLLIYTNKQLADKKLLFFHAVSDRYDDHRILHLIYRDFLLLMMWFSLDFKLGTSNVGAIRIPQIEIL